MREQIKVISAELLIKNGVRGLRFGDIADRLNITRASIHYHFGTKSKLVQEVVEEYAAGVLDRLKEIWIDPDISYEEKAHRTMEFNRSRYERYNPKGTQGRPWSLISRMRLESEQLSPQSRAALANFSTKMERYIREAVTLAQERGEIAAGAPTNDIVVQLVAIVDSAGSITQDAGSFRRLEHLYLAYIRIVSHAYGGKKPARLRRVAAVAE